MCLFVDSRGKYASGYFNKQIKPVQIFSLGIYELYKFYFYNSCKCFCNLCYSSFFHPRINIENQTKPTKPKSDDLDWSYIFSNDKLIKITKTAYIVDFCKTQHLKYIAHVTRLGNDSYKKQILFATEHKKYTRDLWLKF